MICLVSERLLQSRELKDGMGFSSQAKTVTETARILLRLPQANGSYPDLQREGHLPAPMDTGRGHSPT